MPCQQVQAWSYSALEQGVAFERRHACSTARLAASMRFHLIWLPEVADGAQYSGVSGALGGSLVWGF